MRTWLWALLFLFTGNAASGASPASRVVVPTAIPTERLAVSPRGTLLAASDVYRISWIDSRSMVTLRTIKRDAENEIMIRPLMFSSDERFLFAGNSEDGRIEKFDVRTGTVVQTLLLPKRASSASFTGSPDGKQMVVNPRFTGDSFLVSLQDGKIAALSLPRPFSGTAVEGTLWRADGKRLMLVFRRVIEQLSLPPPQGSAEAQEPQSDGSVDPVAILKPEKRKTSREGADQRLVGVIGFVTVDPATLAVSAPVVAHVYDIEKEVGLGFRVEPDPDSGRARIIVGDKHAYRVSFSTSTINRQPAKPASKDELSPSPDARFEAACCVKGLRIRRIPLQAPTVSVPDVSFAAWAPDSKSVFAWRKGTLERYGTDGQKLSAAAADMGEIDTLASLDHGSKLLVRYGSHTSVWSLAQGRPVETRRKTETDLGMLASTASADGRYSVVAAANARLEIYRTGSTKLRDIALQVPGGEVAELAVSADARVGLANVVRTAELKRYLSAVDSLPVQEVVEGDKERMLSMHVSGELCAFSAATGEVIWKRRVNGMVSAKIGVSPGGGSAFIWTETGELSEVDLKSGRLIARGTIPFDEHLAPIWLDEGLIGLPRVDGSMTQVALRTGEQSVVPAGPPGTRHTSIEGRRILSVINDDTVIVDAIASGQTPHATPAGIARRHQVLRISNGDTTIAGAASPYAPSIQLDLANGESGEVPTSLGRDGFWLDEKGKWLAWAENCSKVVFVDVSDRKAAAFDETGRATKSPRRASVSCSDGGFLHGSSLFALSTLRGVEIWDTEKRSYVGVIKHPGGSIHDFRYDHAGRRLLAIDVDTSELFAAAVPPSPLEQGPSGAWHKLCALPPMAAGIKWAVSADGKKIYIPRPRGVDIFDTRSCQPGHALNASGIDEFSSVHLIRATPFVLVLQRSKPRFESAASMETTGASDTRWLVINEISGAVVTDRTVVTNYDNDDDSGGNGAVAVSPDGRDVAWSSPDGRTHRERANSGKKHLATIKFGERIGVATLAPGHAVGFASLVDGWVNVFDVDTGAELARIMSDATGRWIVLAPDGRYDTDMGDPYPLYAVHDAQPFTAVPLAGTDQSRYVPNLLAAIVSAR